MLSSIRLWVGALVLVGFSVWVGLRIGVDRDPIALIFILVFPVAILGILFVALRRRDDDLQPLRKQLDEVNEHLRAIDKKLDSLTKPSSES